MAAERLSMRKIKEVLRLKAAGHGKRAIARSLRISHSTVREYLSRASAAGLSWPLDAPLSDGELEARLFPPPRPSNIERPLPDWAEVHREMKARKRSGVTLQLLWLEYKENHPDGLQYSQFCERYRRWRGRLDLVLRQEHRAGEKVFVGLRRPDGPGHGRDPSGGDLRGRPRCEQLHVRRSMREPGAAGVDRGARTHVRVLRRRAPAHGPGICSAEHIPGSVSLSSKPRVRF